MKIDIKEIRERFYADTLTKEDKKHVVIKERTVKHGKNPWGGKCLYVGESYLYLSGEFKCNLDKKSIDMSKDIKNLKDGVKCKALFVSSKELAKQLGLMGGFYHYNSDRQLPDSVIALKLCENEK